MGSKSQLGPQSEQCQGLWDAHRHPSDGSAPTLGTLCTPGHLPSTVQSHHLCPHTSLFCHLQTK